MANDQLPETHIDCDGCGKDLNILAPYLYVQVKAQREVLVSEEQASEDPNTVADANIYLGVKSGRGVGRKFHNFDCLALWVGEREGLPAKLELHHEDEIYVPEDNPDDEEIARREEEAVAVGGES